MNKVAVSYAPEPGGCRGKRIGAGQPENFSTFTPDEDAATSTAVLDVIAGLQDALPGRLGEDGQNADDHQFRRVVEALPIAIYTTDREGGVTFFNDAAAEFWGFRPRLGDPRWRDVLRLCNPDGSLLSDDEYPMAVTLRENRAIRGQEAVMERADGVRVPFMAYPTPLRDAAGAVIGAVNMVVDVSERKQAEQRQKTLVDELNHRVKNMLATVQSLATQTIRSAGVGRDVLRSFDGRLFALGRVHDLLTLGQWQSADLKSVVDAVIKPYRADAGARIVSNGGTVQLAPREAVLLAMVLHELAANATKYGALSSKSGTLSVVWRETLDAAGKRSLRIEWQEANGPPVQKPQRRGFGARLLERGITSELKGTAFIAYDPGGIHCSICIPLMATEA